MTSPRVPGRSDGARGGRLRPWLPVIAYMALIYFVSSLRVDAPELRRFVLNDKLIHAVEYAILGLLAARASLFTWPSRPQVRTALVGALIAIGWGVADEIHQAFVPWRTADVMDLVADAVGAMAGALIALALYGSRGGSRRSLSCRP